MSDQPNNLILVYLRRMDERLERIEGDIQDLKHRVTALEEGQSRMLALYAGLQLRMDRFDERLARIERRLDLAEARP